MAGLLSFEPSWFALSGAAFVAIGSRSESLRLPVVGAYLVTAAVVGGYLGLSAACDARRPDGRHLVPRVHRPVRQRAA